MRITFLFSTAPHLLLLLILTYLPVPMRGFQSPPQPLPDVRALLDKGEAEERQSRLEEAIRLYDQALHMAKERKDRAGEAAALAGRGHVDLFRQPQKAQSCYEQALPIYRETGDRSGEALCLLNLGNVANLTGQPQKALEQYEAARRIYQEKGDKKGQASVLNNSGTVYRSLGQPRKALEQYALALPLYEELGEKTGLLRVLTNTGSAYTEMLEWDRAQEYLEKAHTLSRALGSKPDEAGVLGALGALQGRVGNARQSLEYLEKALALHEETGNRNGAALCLGNMAQAHAQLGDLLKSLELTRHALALHREMGNRRGMARDLSDLGSFYADVGQPQEALQYYRQALPAHQESGDVLAQMVTLNSMGRLYGRMGQGERERTCYEQSLQLNKEAEDRENEAWTRYYLSGHLMRAGHPAQAYADCEKAAALFREIGHISGQASAALQIGQFHAEANRLPKASSSYEQALALFRSVGDVGGEAETLAHLGALEEKRNRLVEAGRHYAQALELGEDSRTRLGGLIEAKMSYQEGQFPLYQRYIRLLLKTGQEAKAFQSAQKAKSRVLVDLMAAGRIDIAQSMTPRDRQEEERLKRRGKQLSEKWLAALGDLEEIKRQASTDRSRKEQAEEQMQAIRDEQKTVEREWRVFREDLYLRNPQLARQRSARTVTLEETAACLPEDTALLEYVILKRGQGKRESDEVALFVVTQRNAKPWLKAYRLTMEAGSLANLAQEFRAACEARPNTRSERPYKPLARQFYRLLIAPAASALNGKRRLILCPDGPLWDVPFQALLTPSEPGVSPGRKPEPTTVFLWERYALAYAGSATSLKAALEARKRREFPPPHRLLVLANPAFDPDARASAPLSPTGRAPAEEGARGLYRRSGGLHPLPYTRVEANAILASFPDATLKTGRQAQESVVKQFGRDYRYLHFATHAVLNDAAPLLSGVVLARPPKDSQEDGILTARELFDLTLAGEMVVLSACNTARGTQKNGEGIVGLTWALFVAGIPTQIVSQWSVDDTATAKLMDGFYRGLKQGQSKEAALRASALSLRRDGAHGHPFYWAPFLVIGDWR